MSGTCAVVVAQSGSPPQLYSMPIGALLALDNVLVCPLLVQSSARVERQPLLTLVSSSSDQSTYNIRMAPLHTEIHTIMGSLRHLGLFLPGERWGIVTLHAPESWGACLAFCIGMHRVGPRDAHRISRTRALRPLTHSGG